MRLNYEILYRLRSKAIQMTHDESGLVTCGFTGHKFSYCDCEVPTPIVSPHDELLALLNWEVEHQYSRWVVALRAVVELHKPHEACSEGCLTVGWCNECMQPPYPCPTIQAIEKELR